MVEEVVESGIVFRKEFDLTAWAIISAVVTADILEKYENKTPARMNNAEYDFMNATLFINYNTIRQNIKYNCGKKHHQPDST